MVERRAAAPGPSASARLQSGCNRGPATHVMWSCGWSRRVCRRRLLGVSLEDSLIQPSGRAHEASTSPEVQFGGSAQSREEPSETRKPALEAGLGEAADGTRTHDLLHGNRLRFPHKRLLERFSSESDYRGLPGIRPLLVPSVSTSGGPDGDVRADRCGPGSAAD